MKKKIVSIAIAALLTFCFVGISFALEQGNKRKGKYTYRKVYKSCFQRGDVESQKPPVNPDAHTQAEWETLFTNRAFDEFGCEEEWNALEEKDLTDIYTYLYSHASDSPTPAKCK